MQNAPTPGMPSILLQQAAIAPQKGYVVDENKTSEAEA
jgi:hypothetical protein